MKSINAIIASICILSSTAPVVQAAAEDAIDPYYQQCYEGMGITAEQAESVRYKRVVAQCASFNRRMDYAATRLERMKERQEKIISRSRVSRTQSLQYMRRAIDAQEDRQSQERQGVASPRSAHRQTRQQVEQATSRQRIEQSNALRNERVEKAREQCQPVRRTWYQDCVREALRRIGERDREQILNDRPSRRSIMEGGY